MDPNQLYAMSYAKKLDEGAMGRVECQNLMFQITSSYKVAPSFRAMMVHSDIHMLNVPSNPPRI